MRTKPPRQSRFDRILLIALLLGSGGGGARPDLALAQIEYDVTIPTTLGDTTETFWLQIPSDYRPGEPRPLLVGWHQWGGDRFEMRSATTIGAICNERGWIAASHEGVSPVHWNNHPTQSHVVDVIQWIEERYSVDPDRIYMVGASMGGAAGMVFANNHLDPTGPMVAASASISGIQDCERRFHEQGINNSMIASFGGTPDQVPFEYHRNSAVFFADSSESMHVNALHLPLYLTFGLGTSDQVWRQHAEDLYTVMAPYADEVVLRESPIAGHGWSCAEEERICDFLGSFALDRHPRRISIRADEEGRWYWAEIAMRDPVGTFARFAGEIDPALRHFDFFMVSNVSTAELDLPSVGFWPSAGDFTFRWEVQDGMPASLALAGVVAPPALLLRDGSECANWIHDPARQVLVLVADVSAQYTVFLDPAEAPSPVLAPPAGSTVELRSGIDGDILATLREEGILSWGLYDVMGRKLAAARDLWTPAGEIRLDPMPPARSGIYFARATLAARSGVHRATAKLLILR